MILIVPLLDRVIYPCMDSLKFNLTVRSRVLFGMFFSTTAMLAAGYVEGIRLKRYWGEDNEGHPYIQYIGLFSFESHASRKFFEYLEPHFGLLAFLLFKNPDSLFTLSYQNYMLKMVSKQILKSYVK